MKKALSVLVILAALVALVGCGAASTLPGTTWKDSTGVVTYKFGEDGNLTVTSSVTIAGLTTSSTTTYAYTVSGDKLSIKDGDTTTEYTVVKTTSSDGTYYLEIKNSDGNTEMTLYPAD
ncbi:MAG: hypothetical protein K6G52_07335 [Treponemataceae bacterium]|nr:hypothetical protein [Treponemataceae bacterium]